MVYWVRELRKEPQSSGPHGTWPLIGRLHTTHSLWSLYSGAFLESTQFIRRSSVRKDLESSHANRLLFSWVYLHLSFSRSFSPPTPIFLYQRLPRVGEEPGSLPRWLFQDKVTGIDSHIKAAGLFCVWSKRLTLSRIQNWYQWYTEGLKYSVQ